MSKPVIDLQQIRHVARLAELRLDEAEEQKLVEEVGSIVAYFAELDAVDTSAVPATTHVATTGESPLREDVHIPGIPHDEALAGAPRAAHGGFSVPTFVE
jgi:aspartyl-tRNA(Asn)/glutamyl-tRNA(Gln) amidotransferase subunit C